MTCIMWRAASPPCPFGQPSVSHLLSASFFWKERRNSQLSPPASPRAPTPAQSAGISRRRNSRISLRNLSSSDLKRNSIWLPPSRRRQSVYTTAIGFFDMRPLLLPTLLLSLTLAACAGSAVAPGSSPTPPPTSAPVPTSPPAPTL